MLLGIKLKESTEPACKGLIYRGKVNNFINSKGEIVFQERFVPAKKLSCSGCEKCGPLLDELKEHLNMGCLPLYEEIEDGKFYSLCVTNISRDWESGIVDEWDLEFVKVKKKD